MPTAPAISVRYGPIKLAPEVSSPKARLALSKTASWLDEGRKITINVIFFLLLFLLGWALISALRTDEVIVEPANIPKVMKDLGYTEELVAIRLAEEIKAIENSATTHRKRNEIVPRFQLVDITVPGAGISLDSIGRVLRKVFGMPQKRVGSEFFCRGEPCSVDNLTLRVRVEGISNPMPEKKAEFTGSLEELYSQGAEQLLRHINPHVLATYLFDESDQKKRNADALALAREMIDRRHPDKAWAMNLIGLSLYARRGEDDTALDKAIDWYDKATQSDPRLFVAYHNWANALWWKSEFGDAAVKYAKAISINPDFAAAYTGLGDTFLMNGDFDAAITEYEKAVQLDQEYANSYSGWGEALLQKREFSAAIAKFATAIELDPENADAYNGTGQALYANGDFAHAAANYEQASTRAPTCAIAYRNWGLALDKIGDAAGANDKYLRALAIDENYLDPKKIRRCIPARTVPNTHSSAASPT